MMREVVETPERKTQASTSGQVLGLGAAPADDVLVARILDGDRWAQEALYRRHAGRLLGVATRILRSRQDAEDAAHDAFVQAFQLLHKLHNPEAVGGWLMQITVRQCHRRLRRQALRRRLGFIRIDSEDTIGFEELAKADATQEYRAMLKVVDERLKTLKAEVQVAWVLRHVEGQSLADVASLTKCSLATVKRRLATAQEVLGGNSDAQ